LAQSAVDGAPDAENTVRSGQAACSYPWAMPRQVVPSSDLPQRRGRSWELGARMLRAETVRARLHLIRYGSGSDDP